MKVTKWFFWISKDSMAVLLARLPFCNGNLPTNSYLNVRYLNESLNLWRQNNPQLMQSQESCCPFQRRNSLISLFMCFYFLYVQIINVFVE